MSCLHGEGIVLCGNFAKVTRQKPKNWINNSYKIIVPYKFKWREKIGKVKCTCKNVEEHYQPWYGVTWYHSNDCALMQRIKKSPQLMNLWCYRHLPFLASTEEQ